MMRIIAYTFEAYVHCPACTKQAIERMKLDHSHPYALRDVCQDDHGIEYDFVDSDGNLIHPVFRSDEIDLTHCGDCRARL
jgi:hypothetical protein